MHFHFSFQKHDIQMKHLLSLTYTYFYLGVSLLLKVFFPLLWLYLNSLLFLLQVFKNWKFLVALCFLVDFFYFLTYLQSYLSSKRCLYPIADRILQFKVMAHCLLYFLALVLFLQNFLFVSNCFLYFCLYLE